MYLRDNLPSGQSVMGHAMSGTGAASHAARHRVRHWLVVAYRLGMVGQPDRLRLTTISYLLTLMVVIASGDRAGLLTWSIGLLLIALVVGVLLPATRNACLKR